DGDHDGLSNLAELRKYHSNPSNAHTFGAPTDGEYFHAATGSFGPFTPCSCNTLAHLHITDLGGGTFRFNILYAPRGSAYDLYFANSLLLPRWQWRRIYSGVQCDNAGQAVFDLRNPDPSQGQGSFIILDAGD